MSSESPERRANGSSTLLPRSLLILYATETGTAQDVADQVARQCRRIAYKPQVMSIDAYSLPELINEDFVVFIVSTTGSGAEPRSMTTFWNMLLRSDLPPDLFEDLPFAVFALGDTAYEKFCWPGKKLSRRMQSLGAIEICERGEGDDQHMLGVDGALQPWMETLLKTLLALNPLPDGFEMIPETQIPPSRVTIRPATQQEETESLDPLLDDSAYHTGVVKQNQRISANDWNQDVRHFEFEFEDDIQYSPGDVAIIHPIASSLDVEGFLTTMGWGNIADEFLLVEQTMKDQTLPDHLPRVASLRTLFTRYLDFNAVPRRTFFQYLRWFTTDDLEREKLDEFLSLEGADELYEYCHRVRRTIKEVLDEFRHVKIPKDYIFDVFPPLRPREFSISSSVKKYPRQVHLCVAIVKYKTKLKVPRRGICTTYMAALQPGDTLRIGLRKGFIQSPTNPKTPIICIGPGTGVAPMRSLIEERVHYDSLDNTLYFGCRSADKDQHYGKEWTQLADKGQLVYRTAFSRDGPEGVRRTYVQHLIEEDAERIWELVEEKKAYIYISGSSNKMPAAVKGAIAYAIEKYGKRSQEEAKKYVERLVRDGRIIEECWS
ncbi:hypothetical protein AX16_003401 [Volvariella volvacea WC 439]|nr:hypothetical protein AX16_003401 [Volvariella volvacea WC 439]